MVDLDQALAAGQAREIRRLREEQRIASENLDVIGDELAAARDQLREIRDELRQERERREAAEQKRDELAQHLGALRGRRNRMSNEQGGTA